MTSIMNDRCDELGAHPDARFLLVGHGDAREAMQARVDQMGDEVDRLTAANQVLRDQIRHLEATAAAAGRDLVELAARRADAHREIERYLDAGRRTAAEAVLRARRQAAAIIVDAEAHAHRVVSEPTVDASLERLDRRRQVIAESLAALHEVLGTTLHDLAAIPTTDRSHDAA